MAITLRYLIVTFTLLSADVLLRAQPTETKVPVRTTTVQFYYYTVADNSMVQVEPDINLWLQSSRKNKVKVDIVPGGSGTPVTFAGNGPIELFTEVSTEKGIERKVVASLPLPPEVKGVF